MKTETKLFLGIIGATLAFVVGISFFLGKTPQLKNNIVGTNWLGKADAKVTIAEFSDFTCPSCQGAQANLKTILDKYKDRVKFIYKEYPLPGHQFGMESAKAAEAAALQGRFWEFHDKLFEKGPEINSEYITQVAKDLNLDMNKWETDRNSQQVAEIISKDQSDGINESVNFTPTFFINSKRFIGGLSVDQWSKEIEDLLKK